MEKDKNIDQKFLESKKGVHYLLFHSYLVFLFAVILGIIFDVIFPYKIFNSQIFQYLGLLFIILGSLIAYWAQTSSRKTYKKKNELLSSKTYFSQGPYKYLRTPTHSGLFIMTLGLGFLINSLFSVIFVIIAHVISRIFFVNKQEKILELKYGQDYGEYKRKVKNWL